MRPPRTSWIFSLLALSTLPVRVLCGDVLSTDGFTLCYDDPTIQITAMSVTFDRTTSLVTYNIQGSSSQAQNVTAKVTVTAYGSDLYSKEFNPCDSGNYVEALCPGRSIINYGLSVWLTLYQSRQVPSQHKVKRPSPPHTRARSLQSHSQSPTSKVPLPSNSYQTATAVN